MIFPITFMIDVSHDDHRNQCFSRRRSRPQVVIMDEMMPGLNGLEVVRRMRNMPELSDVKVLFYSAAYDWLSQREARDLGAVDWVVKGTIHIDQVAKRVADLCGGIEQD
jgi:DNA-binding response OmpR family regulator